MTIYYIHIKIRCRSFSSFFEYHRRLGNQAMNFLEIKFLLMCIILPLSVEKGKKIFRHNAKRHKSHDLSLSCGRWDLNPHDVTTTRSLVLLVCQFRHFRVSGVSRFCISHRRILIYHTFSCLASTFLNFFYFLNSMFYLYNLYSLIAINQLYP